MLKTLKQELLEVRHQQGIEEIIRKTLEAHRGEKYIVRAAAVDLDVANGTLYQWCRVLQIDLDDYR